VEAVYNKHSYFAERRAALHAWAALLVQIEAGKTNVVPVRAAQKKA
jgi:hypothetical protein